MFENQMAKSKDFIILWPLKLVGGIRNMCIEPYWLGAYAYWDNLIITQALKIKPI